MAPRFEYTQAEEIRDAFARPICHPDDIIASKTASNRAKDREVRPRLRAFRDHWAPVIEQPKAEPKTE